METKYVQVVLDREHHRLNRLFSYAIPKSLDPQPELGSKVWVPLGREYLEGYIVGLGLTPESANSTDITKITDVTKIKEIKQVLGPGPVFTPDQIELAFWIAEYYLCSLIRALKAMLPPNRATQKQQTFRLTPLNEEESLEVFAYWEGIEPGVAQILQLLLSKGECTLNQLSKLKVPNWKEMLKKLEQQGLVEQEIIPKSRKKGSSEKRAALILSPAATQKELEKLQRRAPRQAELLTRLLQESPITLETLFSGLTGAAPILQKLVAKNLVAVYEESQTASPPTTNQENLESSLVIAGGLPGERNQPEKTQPKELTSEQKHALAAIEQALLQSNAGIQAKPILLYGVTGSGKTEVYLRAIAAGLKQGRQAIVLIPEISLTPQTVARFQERFGSKVTAIHSRLTQAERHERWLAIKAGKAEIVIGARSAIFAPLDDLGLIIIDEEHENAYKQDQTPRYHARDVARRRAELTGAVLIMGSATPTLEIYGETQQGQVQLLKLTERVEARPMPGIEVVDLRQELLRGNRSIFSLSLQQDLAEILAKGEQAILFLNRRGFATFVNCRQCGHVLRCRNCAVTLTYHRTEKQLRCHYCDYHQTVPQTCPQCKSHLLRHFGVGTQRVEEELKHLFPEVRSLRVDVDTTTSRNFYDEFYQRFSQGEIDILVGTQLIAKGLDFPKVTLVGVVTADTSLNLPDFRAAERSFQLLTQVAGRAGRAERPGKVIIQTYTPEHYSILAAEKHDFEAFYRAEMLFRRDRKYPPSWRMIRLVISGSAEGLVRITAELLGRYLAKFMPSAKGGQSGISELLGPAPATLKRIRGQFRWQMVIRGPDLALLRKVVRQAIQNYQKDNPRHKSTITVDVDPVNML